MARTPRARKVPTRQLKSTPCTIPSYHSKAEKDAKKFHKMSLDTEQRDWENATCGVCLEHPHNAVLLLCSSHHKGCRPYMCGTSSRHSNCLQQYKKAYAKESNPTWPASKKTRAMKLACPLCRGEVKGWTVVEPAREYLNRKRRSCMHNGCSFIGTYKELRKHVRSKHHSAKAREVDPVRVEKWKKFEQDRERQDVWSTILSSMPEAIVVGDYVIDYNSTDSEIYSDDEDLGNGLRRRHNRHRLHTEFYNALSRATHVGRIRVGRGAFMGLDGGRATPAGRFSRDRGTFVGANEDRVLGSFPLAASVGSDSSSDEDEDYDLDRLEVLQSGLHELPQSGRQQRHRRRRRRENRLF